jgi:hypothetical protein
MMTFANEFVLGQAGDLWNRYEATSDDFGISGVMDVLTIARYPSILGTTNLVA